MSGALSGLFRREGHEGEHQMCTVDRSRFRAPPTSLEAAVSLLLSGVIAAACSATNVESENIGMVADALSVCSGVSLDAQRNYKPKSWVDGSVTFVGGSLTFVVPSEIPVTFGASARGRTKLTFSTGSGDSTTCVY